MPADVRLPDWDGRLMRLLRERAAGAFAWGVRDCATLAADAVVAVTGRDPLAALRGRWSTARAAARVMRQVGGLERRCCELFGSPGPAAWAQRGDVVLVDTDRGPAVGVVAAAGLIAAQGRDGIVWLPLAAARAAWPVGR